MNKKIIILTMMLVFGMTLGHALHYQSKSPGGNWDSKSSWTSPIFGGNAWAIPSHNSWLCDQITIQANHTITANIPVSISNTKVEPSATLSINDGITLTIANGSGTDLTIEGNLTGDGNLVNNSGAAVVIGNNGTYNLSGTATNNGTMTINGTLEGDGNLVNNSGANILLSVPTESTTSAAPQPITEP